MKRPTSVAETMRSSVVPVIAIDKNAMITRVNGKFQSEFGWSEKELVGQPVTVIMPPYLRDAHQIGFSRFITTEQPRVQGKPIQAEVQYKDGRIGTAELYILSEKVNNEWRFAATVIPSS